MVCDNLDYGYVKHARVPDKENDDEKVDFSAIYHAELIFNFN